MPIPVPDYEWRQIAAKPDLDSRLPSLAEVYHGPDDFRCNQPNDHTIFRAADGSWHLWACVRRTKVGRLLVHWSADEFSQSPWRLCDDVIRCDRNAGESVVVWMGEEFLQSPFVVFEDGRYYMFYGGYDTGVDPDGNPTTDYSLQEKQTCLMTSPDGLSWTRHKDENGMSRVFVGPGAVRDQCLMKSGDTWYCYYAGHHDRDRSTSGIYVRTSKDLLDWSEYKIAQFDTNKGAKNYNPESPFVMERGGVFYMFRTHGRKGGTYVFRSDDPLDFGNGDLTGRHLCRLPIIAPEIVVDRNGDEYISTIRVISQAYQATGDYGTWLCRLTWS